jgi:outer membrane protein OmpU
MKKFLFASTALVAAGLMNVSAAEAADKIKLNLGGYSKWWVIGAWQNDAFVRDQGNYGSTGVSGVNGTTNTVKYTNIDVKGANEISFSGSTKLDNGLSVGVMVTLTAGGHSDETTDPIDASYAWVEGGFGKVLLGNHANGVVLLHTQAPDAAHGSIGGSMMGANFAINRTGNKVMGLHQRAGWTTSTNTTAPIDDNKAEKITYVAPSFMGLTVGASYVPSVIREDSRGQPGNRPMGYGAGALYSNTFDGVGVKVSGGFLRYNLEQVTAGAENAMNTVSTGAQLSYAGFTLGGSWTRASHDMARGTLPGSTAGASSNPGSVIAGAAAATATADFTATKGGPLDFGGTGYDIGLMYASGPYAVSYAYFHSEVEGLQQVKGTDKISFHQASGKYTLSPGVDALATVGHASYKSEGAIAGTVTDARWRNSGWVVGTGLSLTF